MAGYQAAVAQGQASGQAGRVIPSTLGGQVNYKWVPAGSTNQWWDQPPAVTQSDGSSKDNAIFGGIDYASFLEDFEKREKGAREANLARETEIRGTYNQLIGQGQGAFRAAGLADIERGKTQAIGSGMQQMVSSGLYGTTTAASIPIHAENQAALSRLKLEDIIQQRQTELKLGKASFTERIEQPYPDYSVLMNAMIAQGSNPGTA